VKSDRVASRRAGECVSYGDRLRAELGYTPVYVRYNTGQHVSDSGHDLAGLLNSLAGVWPEPVREILLVGHSMGGLVIRSACHYGREASAEWVERVRHVFYLGSPHMGAPLLNHPDVWAALRGLLHTAPADGI
jgi:triacylglycerol esterase/lipase EstA (alpha/beta hydrolase family)